MLKRRQRGVTLIELIIGLAIIAAVMVIGLPSYNSFIRNQRVKSLAQGYEMGLQLARAEAIKRNASVRFSLVSSMTNACAVQSSGVDSTAPGWIVSLDDPTSKCNVAPSETTDPRIIQKWDAREAVGDLPFFLYWGLGAAGPVTFNGVGRVNPPFPAAGTHPSTGRIEIELNPASGDEFRCEHESADGKIRCLNLVVTNAGQVRMCDPKVTATADPRRC